MRLLEAIIDANHRALAGDEHAGLHPAEFADELPIIALTCIDTRLNALLPQVLGVPPEHFIWLRNAGNIITGPLSSTMRSLALACAIKGGKEIAIIGHTDCHVAKTTTMELLERLSALGVDRHRLPDNVNEYFGTFASVQGNVIKAVDFTRRSPLIGPGIPVHGLVVDIQTGKVDWLVNGYQALEVTGASAGQPAASIGRASDVLKPVADFKIGEMKFPETKIGETVAKAEDWLAQKIRAVESAAQAPLEASTPKPPGPPKIPLPPPIRPTIHVRRR
jgi:carbonic anhydrase